jgi:hypothetical protein
MAPAIPIAGVILGSMGSTFGSWVGIGSDSSSTLAYIVVADGLASEISSEAAVTLSELDSTCDHRPLLPECDASMPALSSVLGFEATSYGGDAAGVAVRSSSLTVAMFRCARCDPDVICPATRSATHSATAMLEMYCRTLMVNCSSFAMPHGCLASSTFDVRIPAQQSSIDRPKKDSTAFRKPAGVGRDEQQE